MVNERSCAMPWPYLLCTVVALGCSSEPERRSPRPEPRADAGAPRPRSDADYRLVEIAGPGIARHWTWSERGAPLWLTAAPGRSAASGAWSQGLEDTVGARFPLPDPGGDRLAWERDGVTLLVDGRIVGLDLDADGEAGAVRALSEHRDQVRVVVTHVAGLRSAAVRRALAALTAPGLQLVVRACHQAPEALAHLAALGERLHGLALVQTPAALSCLRASGALPHLRWLFLDPRRQASSPLDRTADLSALAGLGRLEVLSAPGQDLTDAEAATLGRLPRLERLDLTDNPLGDAGLTALTSLTSLRALTLASTRITDAGLQRLGGLQRLAWLDLTATHITPAGLAVLVSRVPLQGLRVPRPGNGGGYVGDELRPLLRGLVASGGLRFLDLPAAPVPAVAELAALTTLRGLTFGAVELRAAELASLGRLVGLEWLDLSDCSLGDPELSPLVKLTRLRYLDVPRLPQGQQGFPRLAALGSATGLTVVHLPGVQRDDELAGLPAWPALREIHFDRSRPGPSLLTDRALATLLRYPRLEWLDLDGTGVTDPGLEPLAGLGRLRWLSLRDARITARGLVHLARLTELRDLERLPLEVDDAGAAPLMTLARLRWFPAGTSPLSSRGLRRLGGLRRLEGLHLSGDRVDDGVLESLAPLRELRLLSLRRTRITGAGLVHVGRLGALVQLELDHNRLTNAGLAHLAGARIRRLGLAEPGVTDAGLTHLGLLPRLEEASLCASGITREGLLSLLVERPSLRAGGLHMGDPCMVPQGAHVRRPNLVALDRRTGRLTIPLVADAALDPGVTLLGVEKRAGQAETDQLGAMMRYEVRALSACGAASPLARQASGEGEWDLELGADSRVRAVRPIGADRLPRVLRGCAEARLATLRLRRLGGTTVRVRVRFHAAVPRLVVRFSGVTGGLGEESLALSLQQAAVLERLSRCPLPWGPEPTADTTPEQGYRVAFGATAGALTEVSPLPGPLAVSATGVCLRQALSAWRYPRPAALDVHLRIDRSAAQGR
jgi:hypothetical protein